MGLTIYSITDYTIFFWVGGGVAKVVKNEYNIIDTNFMNLRQSYGYSPNFPLFTTFRNERVVKK